ncbi:MAG: hypothetical protein D6775_05625, partial [Caldilineae bacterium]
MAPPSQYATLSKETRTHAKPLTLTQALDAFVLDCRARRLSPRTVEFYQQKLSRFLKWCEERDCLTLADITTARLRAFLVWLQEQGHSPGGQHAYARALRAWFYFLTAEGAISESPMQRVKMPKVPKIPPLGLSVHEVKDLLDAADIERDKAMILCLVDTGARLSEFAALNVGDVDMSTGAVTLRKTKGGKTRIVYLGHGALRVLRRYLRRRQDLVTPDSPLWVSLHRPQEGRRLGTSGIRLALRRIGLRAGVRHHNPHTFRRTFAIWSLRAGMNIYALRELMG